MNLKSLRIRAFRGVRDWEIPFQGKSLVLWGENASGKSSVVDAMEFLFTGKVNHLTGIRGLSLDQHAPHVYLGRRAVEVSAQFDPGNVGVSRSLTSEPVVPPVLANMWRSASSGAFILRRSQLLQFIHDDPADRFRAIASMMGAEPLDEIELAIKRSGDHFEGDRLAQQQELQRLGTRLGGVAGAKAATPQQALLHLNQEVARLELPPIRSMDDIPATVQQWLRSAKLADQAAVASLERLRTAVESAEVPAELAGQLTSYHDAHQKLLSDRQTVDRLSESDLLEQGEKIIVSSGLPICPLCEQPIDVDETLSRIRARRRMLQDLSEEVSTLRRNQHTLLTSIRTVQQHVNNVKVSAAAITDQELKSELDKVLVEFDERCSAQVKVIESSTEFAGECDVSTLLSSMSFYQAVRRKLAVYVDVQQQTLALTDRDRSILSLAQRAGDVAVYSADFEERRQNLERARELEQRARHIFEAFSSQKKEVIKGVYDAIQADIRQFYDVLHPGEPHSDFRLVLAEGRRASTELRLRAFERSDEDPRAFASEGHLDSLGLCIFLAFARQFGAGCPLVVLDDVIMSIDSSHRGRVAELLLAHFENWQLVITTHDEIWLDELVRHQRAHGAEGRFLNLRIQRWSLQEGPVVAPYTPRWERIEDKLARADKTGAANDGRQLLEWILFEICTTTWAPVALRKDHRYTVGDLQQPALMRLERLLPSLETQTKSLFQEIIAAGTPGNLLSHYNANAESVSLAEIERFCKSAKALVDWYQCPCCGDTPAYSQDARVIRCANSRCTSPKEWDTA